MDTDKYPLGSGRRRFVKGVVGSAALAGVGAGAASSIEVATGLRGAGGGEMRYVGMERTEGPAPRGMPYVPVTTDDEGYLVGVWPEPEERFEDGRSFQVAEMELGGRTYSTEWYQYCGRQHAPGVRPDADQDDYLRSVEDPAYDWQASALEAGERIHLDHLEDYESWGNDVGATGVGKPAEATWRSVGTDHDLPILVIRSARVGAVIAEGGEAGRWMDAATVDDVIAYLNVCTHFCCIPTYKQLPGSAKYDAEDGVYCNCHQSAYDPFSVEFDTFVSLPRPE